MSATAPARPTAADVLRAALELIPDERHWCKGAYAEVDGQPITDRIELYSAYDAGRLDRCCMEAALLLAYRRLHVQPPVFFFRALELTPYRLLADQIGGRDLAVVNDSPHTTYAGIRDAFRRAIAVAEASS